MDKDNTNLPGPSLSNVIQIDDKRIRGHLDKLVRNENIRLLLMIKGQRITSKYLDKHSRMKSFFLLLIEMRPDSRDIERNLTASKKARA